MVSLPENCAVISVCRTLPFVRETGRHVRFMDDRRHAAALSCQHDRDRDETAFGEYYIRIALLPRLKELQYDIHYIGSYNGIEKELIEQFGIARRSPGEYICCNSGKDTGERAGEGE